MDEWGCHPFLSTILAYVWNGRCGAVREAFPHSGSIPWQLPVTWPAQSLWLEHHSLSYFNVVHGPQVDKPSNVGTAMIPWIYRYIVYRGTVKITATATILLSQNYKNRPLFSQLQPLSDLHLHSDVYSKCFRHIPHSEWGGLFADLALMSAQSWWTAGLTMMTQNEIYQ